MQTWLEIEEFSKLVRLDIATIKEMIDKNKLTSKEEDGKIYIEASKGTSQSLPSVSQSKEAVSSEVNLPGADFVEKTIGTILGLHEKVLDAKEETLETLKNENAFLKEALFSIQELYDEDRKTVETLNAQLKIVQEELEFTRRKYKLMWNKTVDGYNKKQEGK